MNRPTRVPFYGANFVSDMVLEHVADLNTYIDGLVFKVEELKKDLAFRIAEYREMDDARYELKMVKADVKRLRAKLWQVEPNS